MVVQDGCKIEFLKDCFTDENGFVWFKKGTTKSCRYGIMINDNIARFSFNMQPGDWTVILNLSTSSFKVL